jgi:hypothetical protein
MKTDAHRTNYAGVGKSVRRLNCWSGEVSATTKSRAAADDPLGPVSLMLGVTGLYSVATMLVAFVFL